ncbi:hypothetical protein L226DRAFT_176708 [Lentinus tigrinus ALCF2SS1-7]|uniref:uncharacterized protein n=1 Tax=Lentinus tigrinus ALCF2SS1-7 TaxID=1328758 RepID=UPI001165CA41|nr:hypothetical protein L226DRAFT_176708 [Lentinus tigrinus ALCF2SS1-7]
MGAVIARTPPFPDALTPLDITSFLNRATKVSHEKLSHVVAGFYVSPLSIEALAELRAATIEFLTAVESVLPSDGSVCLQEPVWTELKQNVAVIFSRFPAQNASYAEGESEIFESIDKILQGKATAPSRVRRPPVTRTTADSLPKTLLRSADSMHHPSPPPSPTDTIACHGRFVFPFFHRKGTKDVSDLCAV